MSLRRRASSCPVGADWRQRERLSRRRPYAPTSGSRCAWSASAGAARRQFEQVIGPPLERIGESALPYALVRLADVRLRDGDWRAAATPDSQSSQPRSETGRRPPTAACRRPGSPGSLPVRGDESDCRRFAAQALSEFADRLSAGPQLTWRFPALGLLSSAEATTLQLPRTSVRHVRSNASGWCNAALSRPRDAGPRRGAARRR